MHVLSQLEKIIFRPATRCSHKEMRIDSLAASASDAPMPTWRCPKSARRRRQSQSRSRCRCTPVRALLNSTSYRTDVPKGATIVAAGGPTSLKILQFVGAASNHHDNAPVGAAGAYPNVAGGDQPIWPYLRYRVGWRPRRDSSVTKMHTALLRAHVRE